MNRVVLLTLLILGGCTTPKRINLTAPVAPTAPHVEDLEDEAGEAAEYYLNKRIPRNETELPVERYFQAIEKMRRMPMYSSKARAFTPIERDAKGKERNVSLGTWTPLGPGNIGGRTRAILIHPGDPNIMYTGGVAGGVWKTADAGASWQPLADLLPNIAIATLAMDPFNPDIIYAGTGEGFGNFDAVRGAGIMKTTDGGATWSRLAGTITSSFYFVNKIVISRTDSQRVYAATATGVWRSLNGGESWVFVLNRSAPNLGCQDLAIRTDKEDDVIFAACRANPSGAIFRTLNGQSDDSKWEPVFTADNMQRTSLALAPSNQDVLYAMATSGDPATCPANPGPTPAPGCYRNGFLGVYRSTQNGEAGSWETRANNSGDNMINATLLSNPLLFFSDVCSGGTKSFSSQGWYDNALAVDPLDENVVWAGGIDLFRSDDGAATFGIASYWWAAGVPQFAHADQHFITFHPSYDGSGNQTMFVTSDGGIYRTDNARAAVAKGDRAACSNTNGAAVIWKSLNNSYAVTQFHHGTTYPGGHFYLGGAQDNGTNRGTDAEGPNQWVSIRGGDGGYVAVHPKDPRILYSETTRLSLARSTDGGRTFRSATTGITEPSGNFQFINPFVMDPSNPLNMWMGARAAWRTTDGGLIWTKASKDFTTGSSITALAAAPTDSNRVMIALADGQIFSQKSALDSDADTVWSVSQPRPDNVSWLAFAPTNPDIAYATFSRFNARASDRHIYKSLDGGTTWASLDGAGDTAVPDIPVHSILPDPSNPQTLYLGTDLGVFVSVDGGQNWAKEDSGFPNTVVEAMSIEKNGTGSILHAFTHGRGAFKVWLGPGDPCSYQVENDTIDAPPAGGSITINLQTSEACNWSAVTNAAWINFDAPPVGSGSASVKLNISPRGIVAREASVLIGDRKVTVKQ